MTNNNDSNQHNAAGNSGSPKSGHMLDNYTVAPKSSASQGEEKSPYYQSSAPSISLPKGGGALKGIDEKFSVNAVNGSASLQVPFPLTPGRSGFTPALSLQYSSGSGNSEFGLGWGMGLPAISRRTDKQLPQYNDSDDSDVFLLAGAEDLLPTLKFDGTDWIEDEYISPDTHYLIKRYVPRTEGLFARIEHIFKSGIPDTWWRVTSKENVVTYYGLTAAGRITDPANNNRIYKWLPELSVDRKGNVQQYSYLQEDTTNVPAGAHERNRLSTAAPFTNTYLKRVQYGNTNPFTISSTAIYEPSFPASPGYLMEAVLDYGDHNITAPTPTPDLTWHCRSDAFSDFHAGFEVRTYRRCYRVLMFHYFAELTGGTTPSPVLVHSLEMSYNNGNTTATTAVYTEADMISSFTNKGYQQISGGGYTAKALPALTCNYQALTWSSSVNNVDTEDVRNAPQGLTGPYQWIDMWGEGLPGILTEQANGWFYKQNLGDGHFTPAQQVATKPSLTGLGSSLQWQDLDADGRRQLVSRASNIPGYFELNDDQQWEGFRSFKQNINIDWNSPFTKVLDLNGDGRPDVLITEERAWKWYENNGTDGYDLGGYAPFTYDEEKGPRMLLNDMVQAIFLADINGDGMTDIVRIQNNEVCYWPNLGYGKFGAKVTMSDPPRFDHPDQFNPMYITLADISGTGAADLIYLGKNQCTAWVNLAGNAWSAPTVITTLPSIDQFSKITVTDFLGHGTACIVWSSPLPRFAGAPLRYIDLMDGNKPYLMTGYSNSMGKSVALTYKQSTEYYLEDRIAGTPWATRLPFPVHCVSNVTTTDTVSQTAYTQLYSYHHGYYDHPEREFRGFGRVDVTDTDTAAFYQTVSGTVMENDLDQFPVLTKTWYHTGAWMRESTLIDAYETEYYNVAGWNVPGLADYPSGMLPQEVREAHRALKGQALRQEVYALDGSGLEPIPYSVTANSYLVKQVQPLETNRYASFFTHQQENVVWHCERNIADPRVLHDLTLSVDNYGNVLESVKVAYPRVTLPTNIPGTSTTLASSTLSVLAAQQQQMIVSCSANSFTNDVVDNDNYHLRVPCEAIAWQVYNLTTPTGLWLPADIKTACEAITGSDIIDFSAAPGTSIPQKRTLSHQRTIYMADNTTSGALALGSIQSLGLPFQNYQLAYTMDILTGAYGTFVSDSMLAEAAYLREDLIAPFSAASPDSGNYWLPSGTMQYASASTSFYTPVSYTDPWGNVTSVTYWSNGTTHYFLLPAVVTDPLGNTTTVNAYDFRCLQPVSVTDANSNISTILFDELCMPVAMAVEGKGTEGDTLTSIDPTLFADIANQAAFWSDPETYAGNLLKGATWRCVYDLTASPVAVAMIAREQHQATTYSSPMQLQITYTDGMGRIAMNKVQAAPDPITSATRWIGSGKTVYNNKGNAVLQYEPYYSTSFTCDTAEQAAAAGVSPQLHYDPLGRVFRTDLPDGTFTSVQWDAWTQLTFDNNDTVMASDWYAARTGTGALAGVPEESDAATKAALHDSTPTIAFLDVLARPAYTIQHNRYYDSSVPGNVDQYLCSYVDMDLLGNRLAIHDARSTVPLQYTYNMVKAVAAQQSLDSGNQLLLTDVAGHPIYAHDPDARVFHYTYDSLRRPLTKQVTPSGGSTKVLELMVYGESVSGAVTNNLLNKLYQSYDGAGLNQVSSYDFKGNPLNVARTYIADYTQHPDWSGLIASPVSAPTMESDTYTTTHTFDALNRPVTITTPDTGVTTYTYDKAGMFYSVAVTAVHSLTTDVVNAVQYDAKGQRTKVQYENGSTTVYSYDPYTFRITELKTTRSSDSAILQDLLYWYDPVGNITLQRDDAQQTVYFNSTLAAPENDYTYDALYRLIQAGGREQIGSNAPVSWNDTGRVGTINPANTSAMQPYIQYYTYDGVGNMLKMKHTAGTGGYVNYWTRNFTISGTSNRLTGSTVGSVTESYTYDARGNMTGGMNHLTSMAYNEENRMEKVIDASTAITTYYQYDQGGQRVRKVTVNTGSSITTTRKYIGQWELYVHTTSSTLDLKRETLHVMDDQARVALIDTPTYNTTGSAESQLLRYQYSDHLSTASLELNDSAAIVSYEEYYPFGNTSFQEGVSGEVSLKRYRYTGKERDEETGLYYHGARYYTPWLARWVASEPLLSLSNFQSIAKNEELLKAKQSKEFTSSYAYVSNNPTTKVDLDGFVDITVHLLRMDDSTHKFVPVGGKDKSKGEFNFSIPTKLEENYQVGHVDVYVYQASEPVSHNGNMTNYDTRNIGVAIVQPQMTKLETYDERFKRKDPGIYALYYFTTHINPLGMGALKIGESLGGEKFVSANGATEKMGTKERIATGASGAADIIGLVYGYRTGETKDIGLYWTSQAIKSSSEIYIDSRNGLDERTKEELKYSIGALVSVFGVGISDNAGEMLTGVADIMSSTTNFIINSKKNQEGLPQTIDDAVTKALNQINVQMYDGN